MSLTERNPEVLTHPPEWADLLEMALTVPGSMGNTYNRFYNYSFANQMLLYMQGVQEPVATFKRWNDMGRHVKKGSKAKAIYIPRHVKRKEEDGTERTFVAGFLLKRCLFGVSDTEGDDLPEVVVPEWSKERALGALAITEVPFTELNGNAQGYSFERNIAINPVAVYPMKTWMHEASHVVAGHTTPEGSVEYRTHRGVMEFVAEGSAYLIMNELELTDQADMAESRSYIQGWLRGQHPSEADIKKVFATTTAILQAGRLTVGSEAEG